VLCGDVVIMYVVYMCIGGGELLISDTFYADLCIYQPLPTFFCPVLKC
jgi:hypothetical protein